MDAYLLDHGVDPNSAIANQIKNITHNDLATLDQYSRMEQVDRQQVLTSSGVSMADVIYLETKLFRELYVTFTNNTPITEGEDIALNVTISGGHAPYSCALVRNYRRFPKQGSWPRGWTCTNVAQNQVNFARSNACISDSGFYQLVVSDSKNRKTVTPFFQVPVEFDPAISDAEREPWKLWYRLIQNIDPTPMLELDPLKNVVYLDEIDLKVIPPTFYSTTRGWLIVCDVVERCYYPMPLEQRTLDWLEKMIKLKTVLIRGVTRGNSDCLDDDVLRVLLTQKGIAVPDNATRPQLLDLLLPGEQIRNSPASEHDPERDRLKKTPTADNFMPNVVNLRGSPHASQYSFFQGQYNQHREIRVRTMFPAPETRPEGAMPGVFTPSDLAARGVPVDMNAPGWIGATGPIAAEGNILPGTRHTHPGSFTGMPSQVMWLTLSGTVASATIAGVLSAGSAVYEVYTSNLRAEELGLRKQDYLPAVWNASKKDIAKGALIGGVSTVGVLSLQVLATSSVPALASGAKAILANTGIVLPGIFFSISAISTILNYYKLSPDKRSWRRLAEELGVKGAAFGASVAGTTVGAMLFGPPGALFFGIIGSLIAAKMASWGVDQLEAKLARDKAVSDACDALGIEVSNRSEAVVLARWKLIREHIHDDKLAQEHIAQLREYYFYLDKVVKFLCQSDITPPTPTLYITHR